ncbi:MAG: glucose-1-phosphate cytidylyltransferase [Oscillospiraceae bacterium]|nr:glucose-1-phosphate cytidylyltransferase [Oscillospiraceae bacterium]
MKTVILAGGFGTRISEESHLKPKPMLEIGEMPILWHILKLYSHYGYDDFVICCGYKAQVVKDYFASYYLRRSDISFDFRDGNKMTVHSNISEPWRVTLVDTGLNTMTGGRIRRIREYIGDEPFMLTYGDGVSNVNIRDLVEYHKAHGKAATLTTVNVNQKFGVLDIADGGAITAFREKSGEDSHKINAGFMVLEPQVFDYLKDDSTVFEQEPLRLLAEQGKLMSFSHGGFWQCMDTQRDKQKLEELWESGKAPWRVWN